VDVAVLSLISQLLSAGLDDSQYTPPPTGLREEEDAVFPLIVQLVSVPPADRKYTPPPRAARIGEEAVFPLIVQLLSVGLAAEPVQYTPPP
jgi:hypothetical protein